jgi:hypothetical protein
MAANDEIKADEDGYNEEYPELGALEYCPICGRENDPDEYDTCEHHWAVQINDVIQSIDPKFEDFKIAWELAIEYMDEISTKINEKSDDDAEKVFDKILNRYNFSDYAPGISTSAAFIDLVDCIVGEHRAGGAGGMGLSIEQTIFLENTDKIDIGVSKLQNLVTDLRDEILSINTN